MNGNPYHVLGTNIPPMLGRERLFDQLLRQLTKPTPDHVSVVGPRHYGKSVLLQHLVNQFRKGGGEYIASAYWDLRHETPDSDGTFLKAFASTIKDSLKGVASELADYIDLNGTTLRDELALVLNELVQSKQRILIVMDGFDHVLESTGISRNTWDTLLSFAQKPSLRFVTGSRSKLRELCRTEDSVTSDFWEAFNPNPLRVGRFEDHDWAGFLMPFKTRTITVDGSGQKEIINWTGGIPVLAASLLEFAYDTARDGETVTKTQIDEIAARVFEERREIIADLWDDCNSELQAEVADLQSRDIRASEINDEHRRDLELRGLVKLSGNVLKTGCTLVGNYSARQQSGLESLRRLFGDSARFSQNARGLLELRIRQVRTVDAYLSNTVMKAIRELKEPAHALTWARSIANRAFELIWKKELPGGEIDVSWLLVLGGAAKDRHIPLGGGACRLLQLATGTDYFPKLTKYVSKRTYALVNFVHSVGDHGQHLKSDEVTWSYATSFCLAAVELCESLSLDFDRP